MIWLFLNQFSCQKGTFLFFPPFQPHIPTERTVFFCLGGSFVHILRPFFWVVYFVDIILRSFEYCLRLRHLKPDEKLNVLVTSHALYFLKGKTPDGDNVVLTVKFSRLHNARYKAEGSDFVAVILWSYSVCACKLWCTSSVCRSVGTFVCQSRVRGCMVRINSASVQQPNAGVSTVILRRVAGRGEMGGDVKMHDPWMTDWPTDRLPE